MTTEINIDNYPKEKKEIIKSIRNRFKKRHPNKRFYPSKITFTYEYGMKIGGNEKYTDVMEYMKNVFGGDYVGKYNKFYATAEGNFPQELIESTKKQFENTREKKITKEKKEKFINYIIKKLGKTPNNFNSYPTIINYPTINELKQIEPKIFEKYSKLTETKMVCFHPRNLDSDEYGFLTYDIIGAFKEIKGDSTIIVCDGTLKNFELFDNEIDTVYWMFNTPNNNLIKKFNSTKESEKFQSKKYYKLSNIEIKSLTNKILYQGIDIERNTKRGIINHDNGLFQINF